MDLAAENVEAMMEPGDTLYVPLAEAKISVTGAVEKPGQYVIIEPVLARSSHCDGRWVQRGTGESEKMLNHAGRWDRGRTGLQSDALGCSLEPAGSAESP